MAATARPEARNPLLEFHGHRGPVGIVNAAPNSDPTVDPFLSSVSEVVTVLTGQRM
jgi:hypothetical protein